MKKSYLTLCFLILGIISIFLNGCATTASSGTGSPSSTGKSGSMARFTIKDDYMYAVSDSDLCIFSLKNKSNPIRVQKLTIGRGIETIFSYKDLLFFGTRIGMLIYNISDRENPHYMSEYQHIYSCDPIVVEDGYAYVTLRTQDQCRQGKNELQIYDVKDPTSPLLIKTYPMKNPWGLGIDNKKLFVCDGKYGLKIFDTTHPEEIKQIQTLKNINGYDVIPNANILIVSARDGIYQFDYTPTPVEQLSRIPVGY